MAAKKPTKQQIAQAKARAGGNTTSKTTPARMAKGAKDIALFAATIAGPGKVAKVAKTAGKAMQLRKDMKYLFGETIKAKKANARGLKAANKPVKNKDASVMNRNNQYARQAILNEKPARPNRVRGGSIKSKQNWPEGMKKPKPSLADPKIAEAKRKADAAARLKRLDYNSRNGIF